MFHARADVAECPRRLRGAFCAPARLPPPRRCVAAASAAMSVASAKHGQALRRGNPVVAPSPLPLPRRVLKRSGADWRRWGGYIAAALCVLAAAAYLEVRRSGVCAPQAAADAAALSQATRVPRAVASSSSKPTWDWQGLLSGLQVTRQEQLAALRAHSAAAAPGGDGHPWWQLPSDERSVALLRARGLLVAVRKGPNG